MRDRDDVPEARAPGYLGYLAIVFGAVLAFAWIAQDVVTGGRLTLLDARTAQWLHLHSDAQLRELGSLVSLLNSTWAIFCYAALVGGVALALRKWSTSAMLAACVGGGLVLNELMKLAFRRPRPQFEHPFATLASFSFPSGHVSASTVFYASVVAWVFVRTPTAGRRALAFVAATSIVSLVAFSRMVLGLHYLTDVCAAAAEGIAWVALCLACNALWQTRPPA